MPAPDYMVRRQEMEIMYPAVRDNTSVSGASPKVEGTPDQFPAGLRVLAVDDDPICLKILEKMLRKCLYEVTACCQATIALSMLRERKGRFDIVISDVHMPDMDGFKLLEHVGLEMDLPVIMMSADGETSVVMKGIKHGACDYLIKPVRIEELKNIWQHVVRKKRNEAKELEHSGSVEDSERTKKGSEDVDYASSVNEGVDGHWKLSKKKREAREEDDDDERDNDDPSALKKPRVVWSVELHQQFVCAVNQLGIDKAVPKRILELMGVQGLTRENVASHLQKYRLYLKRLNGVAQQQSGINSSFGVATEESSGSVGLFGRFDLQALASLGQISPQTLGALQVRLLGRVKGNNELGMTGINLPLHSQEGFEGVNCNSLNTQRYRHPLISSQGSLLQELPSSLGLEKNVQPQHYIPLFGNVEFSMDGMSPGFSMLQQPLPATPMEHGGMNQTCGINNNAALNLHNNMLMVMPIQNQKQPVLQPRVAQLPCERVVNQSSASLAGSQVGSNDVGGRAYPVSAAGNSSASPDISMLGASSLGQVNNTPAPAELLSASASNASVGIGQTSTINNKDLVLPILGGNDYPPESNVHASDLLTLNGMEGVMTIPRTKILGGMSDIVNSQASRGPCFNIGTLNSPGQSLNQSSRQVRQVQNLALNQNSSQVVSPSLNIPHYSLDSSQPLGSNVTGMLDQAQVRSHGFVGKGLALSSSLASDAGCLRTIDNAQCQSKEPTVNSGLKSKCKDVSVFSTKAEGALLSEQFSPSDDHGLMNYLLKQQKERTGHGESEIGMDRYQLDSIYLK